GAWQTRRMLTPFQIKMKAGARLDYGLGVHVFPVNGKSKITFGEPPLRFVDEQRRGPYRLWIHEHRFEPRVQGTLCKDFVRYAVPGGWVIERLFVRRDVERIFAFRREKLLEMFS